MVSPKQTLILEPNPMRARHWAAFFGSALGHSDLARSRAEARVLLLSDRYDRLCIYLSDPTAAELMTVARVRNPDCEVVDLESLTVRLASGPLQEVGPIKAGSRPGQNRFNHWIQRGKQA